MLEAARALQGEYSICLSKCICFSDAYLKKVETYICYYVNHFHFVVFALCNLTLNSLRRDEVHVLTAVPPGQVRDAEQGGEEVEQGPRYDDAVVDVWQYSSCSSWSVNCPLKRPCHEIFNYRFFSLKERIY